MGAIQNTLVFSQEVPLNKEAYVESLKIIVKGLSPTERRLLAATVKLSERREPKLEIVPDGMIDIADVIIVDSADVDSMRWSNEFSDKLDKKTVVWVDAEAPHKRHGSISRPVLWVNLPIIISRIMDEVSVMEITPKIKKASEASPVVVQSSAGNSFDILVVDDSPAIREHLSGLLKAKGHKVIDVDCGELAVDMVDRQSFDCVFMDVMMPGIDGYEACKKIKAKKLNGKTLPVIMLTGKSSPFDRIRGKMAGCDAYLTKPTSVGKLVGALEKAVAVHV